MEHTGWWMPTEVAATYLHTGIDLRFTDCDPGWLSRIPTTFTQRHIWTGPVSNADNAPSIGMGKVAAFKTDTIPAGWGYTTALAEEVLAASGTPDSWLIVADTWLDIRAEFRSFITFGTVAGTDCYRVSLSERSGDDVLSPDATEYLGPDRDEIFRQARTFTQTVVDTMGDDQPLGYVLDVALLANNTWAVIEANPAWSSNPYDVPSDAVITTVAAATVPALTQHERNQFRWTPDPWLVNYASRRHPLPVRSPVWLSTAQPETQTEQVNAPEKTDPGANTPSRTTTGGHTRLK